ncbi:MAG TPA: proline iminopeptidase-family hydrolase [Polyangium sp.]|nr:proline iminopeptidase-family hydrolase [Polyangium sp.]
MPASTNQHHSHTKYLDYSNFDDLVGGGARKIPIQTPKGTFKVWVKRTGNNPRIKVLLLHGGPGATHECLEACDSYFPTAKIEYYYYDQLGSAYSDQPNDPDLWDVARFVDEVEQVRQALKLDNSNFYLYGHSWGGVLGVEYALKYQEHLKGLIISNMMASVPACNAYAKNVLEPQIDPAILKQILAFEAAGDYNNPEYMKLLVPNFYEKHFCRMPYTNWPDPLLRSFSKINQNIYVPMQGPSELGTTGKLEFWDRMADLHRITVPTLTIGARYCTMDPAYMKAMAQNLPRGQFHYCPHGSHMTMFDDQKVYFEGLTRFLRQVDGHSS